MTESDVDRDERMTSGVGARGGAATTPRRLHERQTRLEGVGPEGQARLAAGHVHPGRPGPAREVAEAYLRRAGVGRVDDEGDATDVDVSVLGIRDASARGVAEGALVALAGIRQILFGGERRGTSDE